MILKGPYSSWNVYVQFVFSKFHLTFHSEKTEKDIGIVLKSNTILFFFKSSVKYIVKKIIFSDNYENGNIRKPLCEKDVYFLL